jgi:hypothetical protein
MMGNEAQQALYGVTPRAINELFRIVNATSDKVEYKIQAYMLELYNDNLVDLLSDQSVHTQLANSKQNNEKLVIKKDAKGLVFVQGVNMKTVKTAQQLESLLHQAFSRRRTEETNLNEHSSRSHLIISIVIESVNLQTKEVNIGKLSFVDLAGSERVGRSGVKEERLKEAQSINKSLTALGHVVSLAHSKQCLSERYLHSQLVRVLFLTVITS